MAMIAASERFLGEHLGGRYQRDMPEDVASRLDEITVDPATVVLAKAPSEAEKKAVRPVPVRGLTPGTSKYDVKMSVMGQDIAMSITETIEDTPEGYVVTQEMSSPMGAASDVVIVSKEGLSPKQRTAKQGPAVIEMSYPEGSVKGAMKMGANEQAMDFPLDGALFSDGAAEGPSVAALPLAEGYTAMLRTFDVQTQQAALKRLTVTGKEQVEVPATTAEAYRVELKPADGSAGETVYYVEAAAPHRVLKVTAVVPAMNGAVMEQVLVE